MDDRQTDQKLQEALELFDQGYSYNDIRKHFKSELSEDDIAYIIRLTDEFALEESRIREEMKKAKFKIQLGAAALILAILLILAFDRMDALQGASALLAYLPLLFAFYLLGKGYTENIKLKKTQPEISDSKFRMKRRKKAS